jgi:hypothetical protein
MLYSLAAVYIAMTEAISTMFGKSIEPLASHLIEEMLPDMPEDAADLCRCMVEFAGSEQQAPSSGWLEELISASVH